MVAAAVLFAITALGGAAMAAIRLSGREFPPLWIVIPHGIAAAAGLVTLMMTVAGRTAPAMAGAALIGFVIAFIAGITLLFVYHVNKRPLSIPLMLTHGTVAVVSFVILLMGIFQLI